MSRPEGDRLTGLTNGMLAGAVGTLAREFVSYLDMGVRARPESDTHERTVQRIAGLARLSLGPPDLAARRRAGLGPVLGFVNGVTAGAVVGVLTGRHRGALPVSAAVLGAGAMLFADTEMTLLGTTKPRTWGARGWLGDLVPHVAYGLAAAAALRRLDR